jgi:hypothetical protein
VPDELRVLEEASQLRQRVPDLDTGPDPAVEVGRLGYLGLGDLHPALIPAQLPAHQAQLVIEAVGPSEPGFRQPRSSSAVAFALARSPSAIAS